MKNHPRIQVHTRTQIQGVSGYIGNFRTLVRSNENEEELSHGVIIVATGGEEYSPEEYLHGKHKAVLTQKELGGEAGQGRL